MHQIFVCLIWLLMSWFSCSNQLLVDSFLISEKCKLFNCCQFAVKICCFKFPLETKSSFVIQVFWCRFLFVETFLGSSYQGYKINFERPSGTNLLIRYVVQNSNVLLLWEKTFGLSFSLRKRLKYIEDTGVQLLKVICKASWSNITVKTTDITTLSISVEDVAVTHVGKLMHQKCRPKDPKKVWNF